jgi:predicted transcriptional regulator
LAKKLGRGFKSVSDDVKLLERLGFIELIEEKTKKRIRHKPVIVVDTITIHIKV